MAKYKQIINGSPDQIYRLPSGSLSKGLKPIRIKLFGKDWRKSSSEFLRNSIVTAIEFLLPSAQAAIPKELLWRKPFDHTLIEEFLDRHRDSKKTVNEASQEVYMHLKLFGIELESWKTVEAIYRHYKTPKPQ